MGERSKSISWGLEVVFHPEAQRKILQVIKLLRGLVQLNASVAKAELTMPSRSTRVRSRRTKSY